MTSGIIFENIGRAAMLLKCASSAESNVLDSAESSALDSAESVCWILLEQNALDSAE